MLKRRDFLVKVRNPRGRRNTVLLRVLKPNATGMCRRQDCCHEALSAEVKLDAELAEIDAKLTEFTTTLPNIPADSVPLLVQTRTIT